MFSSLHIVLIFLELYTMKRLRIDFESLSICFSLFLRLVKSKTETKKLNEMSVYVSLYMLNHRSLTKFQPNGDFSDLSLSYGVSGSL